MKTKRFHLFRKEFNVVLLFLLLFYAEKSSAQYCELLEDSEPQIMGSSGGNNPDCSNQINYAPDNYSPLLYIKVNFHFMQKPNLMDPHNFDEDWDGIDADHPMNGDIWAQGIIDMMNNDQLSNNPPMNLPPGNETENLPYNFRFMLMNTYYWPDGNLWDACNWELPLLVQQYGVNINSEINVFFTSASGGPGCGDGGAAQFGGHIIIKGSWQGFNILLNDSTTTFEEAVGHSYWSRGRLLLHELGHVMNLRHTLNSNTEICGNEPDGVDDTPSYSDLLAVGISNPCCYNNYSPAYDYENPNCTNNLMDYSGGYALTPHQLGRSFNFLLNNEINLIYEDYCQNNPNLVTVIPSGENLVWNQTRIFKGDVVLEPQSTVRITCTVYMPIGAKIIVKPGAKLIIDGGTITQRCGGLWQGIEVWGNYNLKQTPESNQGVLEVINDGTIEWAVQAFIPLKPYPTTNTIGPRREGLLNVEMPIS